MELESRGVVRVSGLVTADMAALVADRTWEILGRCGMDRGDRRTWPVGRQSKLQALRRAEVYAQFVNDRLHAIADQLLCSDQRPQAQG